MVNEIQFRNGTLHDLTRIQIILKENDLPFKDIQSSDAKFIVATNNNRVIGCIGLEAKGRNGLLRSFVVINEFENRGVGKELIKKLIGKAQITGIGKLHLLTTTAELYFKRIGFKNEDRMCAPSEIKKTTEFSEICPLNSIYLTLNI